MFVAHITHEAVEDMGGIGTVIAGLTTSKAYGQAVSRTVLVGPLFSTDKPTAELLGPGGKILYSSLDEIYQDNWREKFGPIERTYNVGIIYGTRKIHEPYSGKAVDVELSLIHI